MVRSLAMAPGPESCRKIKVRKIDANRFMVTFSPWQNWSYIFQKFQENFFSRSAWKTDQISFG